MAKEKKQTNFIHQPVFKGGPKALHNFIYAALRYPAAALEKDVEGVVLVEYDINYKGIVTDTRVLQGLGYGCDEEACRVVRQLKFEVGKNRGVHVIFHQKIQIHFKKPVAAPAPPVPPPAALQMSYTLVPATPAATPEPEKKAGTPVYTYTIG